ncbi:MAG: serine/threonine-protein kinase [bacterium]
MPARFGGFLLLGLLGRGGMGAVYHGLDEQLNRHVAIKVLQASIGANAEMVATFRREARSAAALNHPSVVQVYSFGVERGQPYMAMELLTGGRLDQMIAKGEPLDEAFVLGVGASIAQGLSAANDIGLMHGDVKPENILFDKSGVPKIVDFGLATFIQQRQNENGVWGTPYYIAPEKVRHQTSDARSDIYSLGATLFHALTGKPPFDGETPLDVVKARLLAPAPRIEILRPEISPATSEIIARMLEMEPARRYPTYASLLGDLPSEADRHITPPSVRMNRTGRNFSSKNIPSIPGETGASTKPAPAHTSPGRTPAGGHGTFMWRRYAVILGSILMAAAIVSGIVLGVRTCRQKSARELARQQASSALEAAREAAANQVSEILRKLQELPSVAAVDKAVESEVPWLTSKVSRLLIKLPPEIQTTRRADAEQLIAALQAATQSVARTFVEARNIRAEARSQRDAIAALTNASDNLTAWVAALGALQLQAAEAVSNGHASVCAATQTVANMHSLVSELEKQATLAIQQTQAQQAELALKAQATAARQKAEKDRIAQAALAAKEIDAVTAARQGIQDQILHNDFQGAAKSLRSTGGTPATTPAREALAVEIERCERLIQLKAYLVQAIQKEAATPPQSGYRYGWLVDGVPKLDVIGASAETIALPDRQAPWSEAGVAQMLRFLAHYVEQNEGLDRQTHAAQLLNAAVYMRAVGGSSERAIAMAAKYASQAHTLDASLAPAAARLVSGTAAPESVK